MHREFHDAFCLSQPVAPGLIHINLNPRYHTCRIDLTGQCKYIITIRAGREIRKNHILCFVTPFTAARKLEVYTIVAAKEKT